ncbi:MAG: desulfoferrodoxin [Prevotella sp.]|nr:desulfoferrodoxin [Candidatus Prevotella equi]
MEERFFYCESCGNLFIAAIASGVVPYCCDQKMTLLRPNTTDGNQEKHLPVVDYIKDGVINVRVGSDAHPMTPEHNIRFICVETNKGIIIRYFKDGDKPEARIHVCGVPKAVYAYCNIHGLWRSDIPPKESYKGNCSWYC